jgi:hypothetical protein
MRIYTIGDRVAQTQYGPGTVTDANERYTVIDFDNHGIHRFVTSVVRLESTTEPAPPRAARKRVSRKKTDAAAR